MNTAEILSLRKGDVLVNNLIGASGYTVSYVDGLQIYVDGFEHPLALGFLSQLQLKSSVVCQLEPKKLSLMEKLAGCTFKFGLMKNTRGAKNQNFIDKFSGSEFVFQSFSGAYVYGYPVGHFGDPDYRCQFDASAVRFFHEDQEAVDSVPDITLLKKIKHTADL